MVRRVLSTALCFALLAGGAVAVSSAAPPAGKAKGTHKHKHHPKGKAGKVAPALADASDDAPAAN